MNKSEECGSGCQCDQAVVTQQHPTAIVVASVNGVALHAADEQPDATSLHERACAELLRQQAVKLGLLPGQPFRLAPELDPQQQEIIESMLERGVVVPQASEEACQRHYAANRPRYMIDQAMHLRHILFAVTPGVNVQKLAQRAEVALLELARKDAGPGRFEQLARELSNCPSSVEGGDLGWVGPHDCASELAQALFFQSEAGFGLGVHPRLLHTRYGLHIIEVLEQRKGRQLGFEAVRDSIAAQLSLQSRATALRQYMMLLVGQADVVGVELEGADTPLVQ